MGLQESFYSFVDWADQHGIPLGKLVDFFESKGIPALPAFILIFIAIIAAIVLLVTSLLAPAVPGGTVLVSVTSEGLPLQGADVMVSVPEKSVYKSGVTDSSGKIAFDGIPFGEATVAVQKLDFQPITDTVVVSSGAAATKDVVLSPAALKQVTLTVQLKDGKDGQPVDGQVLLLDATGQMVQNATSAAGTLEFKVDSNANYRIRTSATGYSDDERGKAVSDTDTFINIALTSAIERTVASVSVAVKDGAGNPLPNIKVELIDEATDKVLASDYTGESGAIKPQDVQTGVTIHALATDESGKYLQNRSDSKLLDSTGDVDLSVTLFEATAANSDAISINVRNKATGQALSGATVRLYQDNSKLQEATTAADGLAKFTVAVGNYLATAYAPGYLPLQNSVSAGSMVMELDPASVENSGKLVVSVTDWDTNPVPDATVALFTAEGSPLGIPEVTTGLDGSTAIINDVPGIILTVRAIAKGSTKETSASIAVGETNTVAVQLEAASAQAKALVTNARSGAPIASALISFMDSSGTLANCTTAADGTCSASIRATGQQVWAEAGASGYGMLTSPAKTAIANTTLSFDLSLTPGAETGALSVKLKALYDSKGVKVTGMTPIEDYKAVFSVVVPDGASSFGGIHIRVGGEGSVRDELATITGFKASNYLRMWSGSGYNPGNLESDLNSTAVNGNYKWVQYEFTPGTHEVSVNLRAAPGTVGSTVTLNYRAYSIKGTEISRTPEDAAATEAWTSETMDLYANTLSQSFNVTAGTMECFEDFCIGLQFVKGATNYPTTDFTTERGSDFSLAFEVRGAITNSSRFSLFTDSPSIDITGWQTTAPAAKTGAAQKFNLSQTVSIPASGTGTAFRGTVGLRALRYDKAAELTASYGEFERTIAISITGKGKLSVTVKPTSLSAPSENNTVEVTVKDDRGGPITDAHVSLVNSQRQPLAATVDVAGNGDTNFGRNGVYKFEDVRVEGLGQIAAGVSTEGFDDSTTPITVSAQKLIEVSPPSIVAVLSDETKQYAITVRNLLNEAVKVDTTIAGGDGDFTSITVLNASIMVPPKGTEEVLIEAGTKAAFFPVTAGQPTTRSESLSASANLAASLATSRQREKVSVKVNNTASIKNLDGLWSTTPDTLTIELTDIDNETTRSSDSLSIVNNMSNAELLVNYKLHGDIANMLKDFRIDPISVVVPPGGTALAFAATASLPDQYKNELSCIQTEQTITGTMELIGSVRDAVSTKNVTVNVVLKPSGKCNSGWGINETAVTFQLSDIPKTATAQVCLFNHAKRNIDISATTAGDTARIINSTDGGLRFKLLYGAQTSATVAPGSECVPFEITAKVPQDLMDVHGCATDYSIDGEVQFTASADGYTANQSLPVSIQISPSEQCPWKIAQSQGAVFNSLFINYATDLNMQFRFKGPGQTRYLTFVNNYDQPVNIESSWATAIINCDVPATMNAGTSYVSTCASAAPGGTMMDFLVKSTSGALLGEKQVAVTVYDPTTVNTGEVYQNTPLGVVSFTPAYTKEQNLARVQNYRSMLTTRATAAPTSELQFQTVEDALGEGMTYVSEAATTAGEAQIIDCATHFCNSDQTATAFADGVMNYLNVIKRIKDMGSLEPVREYCSGPRKVLEKSTVIQMANTQLVGDYLQALGSSVGYHLSYGDEMRGCGVYTVRYSMDFCQGIPDTVEQWATSRTIGFTIHKAASCDNNLANAALFMVPEPGEDKLKVKVGNEEGSDVLGGGGLITMFNEKKYSHPDLDQAKQVQRALYGQTIDSSLSGVGPNKLIFDESMGSESGAAQGILQGIFTTYVGIAAADKCKATGPGAAACVAGALATLGLCNLGRAMNQDYAQIACMCGMSELTIWGGGKYNAIAKVSLIAGVALTVVRTYLDYSSPAEKVPPAVTGALGITIFQPGTPRALAQAEFYNLASAREQSKWLTWLKTEYSGSATLAYRKAAATIGYTRVRNGLIARGLIVGRKVTPLTVEDSLVAAGADEFMQNERLIFQEVTYKPGAFKAAGLTGTDEELVRSVYASEAFTANQEYYLKGLGTSQLHGTKIDDPAQVTLKRLRPDLYDKDPQLGTKLTKVSEDIWAPMAGADMPATDTAAGNTIAEISRASHINPVQARTMTASDRVLQSSRGLRATFKADPNAQQVFSTMAADIDKQATFLRGSRLSAGDYNSILVDLETDNLETNLKTAGYVATDDDAAALAKIVKADLLEAHGGTASSKGLTAAEADKVIRGSATKFEGDQLGEVLRAQGSTAAQQTSKGLYTLPTAAESAEFSAIGEAYAKTVTTTPMGTSPAENALFRQKWGQNFDEIATAKGIAPQSDVGQNLLKLKAIGPGQPAPGVNYAPIISTEDRIVKSVEPRLLSQRGISLTSDQVKTIPIGDVNNPAISKQVDGIVTARLTAAGPAGQDAQKALSSTAGEIADDATKNAPKTAGAAAGTTQGSAAAASGAGAKAGQKAPENIVKDASGKEWKLQNTPEGKVTATSKDGQVKIFNSPEEAKTAIPKVGCGGWCTAGAAIGGGLIGAFIDCSVHEPEAQVNHEHDWIVSYHRVKPWDGLTDTTSIYLVSGWKDVKYGWPYAQGIRVKDKCDLKGGDKICIDYIPLKGGPYYGGKDETSMLLVGVDDAGRGSRGEVEQLLSSIVDPDADLYGGFSSSKGSDNSAKVS